MKFRATITQSGKTATGIPVPAEVIEKLGQGRRPRVSVSIGGYTYRSTVGVVGGAFMIPLSAEHRTAAGVAAGQEAEVDIEPDTAPREVSVPEDFAAALDSDEAARRAFEAMPYSHKQRWVLSVSSAKAEETRKRRIAKAIEALRGS